MAATQVLGVALLIGLLLPSALAGNANGAATSSQSSYTTDTSGNIVLSPAGNNNNNGNGQGTSAAVIDWYNDQEYPTCPLKACPPFKHFCSGGKCNDTAGILGRWRLPEQSANVCPPGARTRSPTTSGAWQTSRRRSAARRAPTARSRAPCGSITLARSTPRASA
ncbi:hypothetical protein CLOM_g18856 [Closterium sp. NIES-68]|nr:hypothetical protein CLOM_g18856 [Closterium sp. NIES-68]